MVTSIAFYTYGGSYMSTHVSLNLDWGVGSLIPAQFPSFMEIDHEIISTAILLPSADSRRIVVSHKQKYVYEVLVNCLFKLAQDKSG